MRKVHSFIILLLGPGASLLLAARGAADANPCVPASEYHGKQFRYVCDDAELLRQMVLFGIDSTNDIGHYVLAGYSGQSVLPTTSGLPIPLSFTIHDPFYSNVEISLSRDLVEDFSLRNSQHALLPDFFASEICRLNQLDFFELGWSEAKWRDFRRQQPMVGAVILLSFPGYAMNGNSAIATLEVVSSATDLKAVIYFEFSNDQWVLTEFIGVTGGW